MPNQQNFSCKLRGDFASGKTFSALNNHGYTEFKSAGNDHFKARRYAEACEQYDRAFLCLSSNITQECHPEQEMASVLWSNKAECCLQMKDYKSAASCCETALTYDPCNSKAEYRLARALHASGDLDGAKKAAILCCELITDCNALEESNPDSDFIKRADDQPAQKLLKQLKREIRTRDGQSNDGVEDPDFLGAFAKNKDQLYTLPISQMVTDELCASMGRPKEVALRHAFRMQMNRLAGRDDNMMAFAMASYTL